MRQLVKTEMCKSMDIGINDNLFGGVMLKWLDEAGAILAFKETGGNVVTLKFNEVLFKIPVKVKDIIEIYGEVTRLGTTSITIHLEAGNMKTGEVVCSTDVVFVHVDAKGWKLEIPEDRRKRICENYHLVP